MNSKFIQRPIIGYPLALTAGMALVALIALARADGQQTVEKPAKKKDAAAAATTDSTTTVATSRHEAKKEARRHAFTMGAHLEAQGNQGLVVSSLDANSHAAQAGLQQHDRIISVDGRGFTNASQFDAYLASQGGRNVPILIERGGRQMTIVATPAQIGGETAWLGVFLEEGDANTKGARITHVYPSGPAARAGLQMGDTVTKVNDTAIEHPADLINLVQESEPQAKTEFHVLRNGQETNVSVALGSRSQFVQQASYQNGNGGYPQNGGNYNGNANQNGQAVNGQPANGPYAEDPYENVPSHAMHLENDRRNAEQHQRIEDEIRALRDEIRQLREDLKKK